MLNVTNGDSAAQALQTVGVEGDILPWRDVLHEGPPGGGPAVRAAFLAQMYGVDAAEIQPDIERRDARLAQAVADCEPIILWFDADLYDLLQLLQILDRVEAASLIIAGDGDPVVGIAEGPPSASAAVAVTEQQLRTAREAWAAICSGDPQRVAAIDGSPLPGLSKALTRWLEELPWTTDGLTRSERQLLRAVLSGCTRREDAFAAAQYHEDRPFLGDVTAYTYLERMASGTPPLIEGIARSSELIRGMSVTPAGRELVAGDRIWVRPEPPRWLWDPQAGHAVAAG